MEMIRHQNIVADEYTTRQPCLAKLAEIFMNFGVGKNGFAVFGVRGDEVRGLLVKSRSRRLSLCLGCSGGVVTAGELPEFMPGIVAALCERRKKLKTTAVTDRRYSAHTCGASL
ncbi:MAG: hypothetical protein U1F65_04365 [Verrucomicrobiota bacterium]